MEARTLRCAGCGASVPADAPQCPYCRAQVATVACPACFALAPLSATHCPGCGTALAPRAAAAADGAPCPACAKPLATTRIGDLDARACQACGGLWLDRVIFEQLGASRERQGTLLSILPPPAVSAPSALEPVRYRPCPACGQRMNRVNYAKRSGVVLDVCRDHGLWFDRDELRRVLAFIAGGGLDRARERELQDLKEARRAMVTSPSSGGSLGLGEDVSSGQWLGAAGLVALVHEVAELFHRD